VETSAPAAQLTIACHTCGAQVKLVRSVRIRQWIGPLPEGAAVPFRDVAAEWRAAKHGIEGSDFDLRAVCCEPRDASRQLQYIENMRFRRASICNDCYQFLDNYLGCGVIAGPEARCFGLASSSRRGRAAAYDYTQWRRFQRKLASEMGIELEA